MAAVPESDQEPLCNDAPLGRRGWTFVSADIAFFHRDADEWNTVLADLPHDDRPPRGTFRLRSGVFLELNVQVRMRRFARWLPPRAFVAGLDFWLDDPTWSQQWKAEPGVRVSDITRLAEISREYNQNLRLDPSSGHNLARFIPVAVELEIRRIAERLRLCERAGP